jgi:hypothetical protein
MVVVQTFGGMFEEKSDIGLFAGLVDRYKINIEVEESGLVDLKFKVCVC